MPNGPFGTTGARRLWTFVGLWAVTITSIISYVTTPRAGGALSVLQAGGVFYYRSQVALDEFAAAATVPEWVVLFAYGILATVLLGIAAGVLLTGAADAELAGPAVGVVLLTVVSGVVAGSAVFLTATLAGSTIVADLLGVVVRITPPVLSLSPFAVVIAVITAYVP